VARCGRDKRRIEMRLPVRTTTFLLTLTLLSGAARAEPPGDTPMERDTVPGETSPTGNVEQNNAGAQPEAAPKAGEEMKAMPEGGNSEMKEMQEEK
jgi:hypothetical protein